MELSSFFSSFFLLFFPLLIRVPVPTFRSLGSDSRSACGSPGPRVESAGELVPESASGAGKPKLSPQLPKDGGAGTWRVATSPTVGGAETVGEVESAAAGLRVAVAPRSCHPERAPQDYTLVHG